MSRTAWLAVAAAAFRKVPLCGYRLCCPRIRRAISSSGTPFVSGTIASTHTSCRIIIPPDAANRETYGDVELADKAGPARALARQAVAWALCPEDIARPFGSTFDPLLEDLKRERVGAYNWGFVAGKTQTNYPWDSWEKTCTAESPLWFHDSFRSDGTPYRLAEVLSIRHVTGRSAAPAVK